MLPQVGSSRPIRLDLHADPIALRRERTRERVAAKEWRAAAGPSKTQDDVLAGPSRWQRLTVRAQHRQREDIRRLLIDRRHPSGRNPGATGYAAAAGASPALPLPAAVGWLCSKASNDERHPGESASIRKARCSRSRA